MTAPPKHAPQPLSRSPNASSRAHARRAAAAAAAAAAVAARTEAAAPLAAPTVSGQWRGSHSRRCRYLDHGPPPTLEAAAAAQSEAPTASLQSSYSDSIRGPTEGPCARSNPMATLWWDPLPQFAAPAAAAAAAVPAGVERASGRAAEQLSFHHSLPCLRPKFGQLMRLRCYLHPSLENFRPKPESKQNKRRVSWV